MAELITAVAAALPQSILIGVVVGMLVYSLRGPKAGTAIAQFFLGLSLGIIIGCIFNITQVLNVVAAVQASAGLRGSGIINLGLAPAELRILVQRLLLWGGAGGAIGLLRVEPGEMASGVYYGALMGIVAGVIVATALHLIGLELSELYYLGVNAVVVTALLLFASIQADKRRTHIR
ncbi:MAG: hypothetical protein KJ063_16650 [Anaerolineae bacterium]|nr:hypothetical protein [Anaerolineae bacterium]